MEMASENKKEKKEKPEFLYHGSPHKNMEQLKPQSAPHRDEHEELLYAIPDHALASTFLIKKSFSHGCGKFGDVPYAWIVAKRDEFISNDNGGHIYVLPGATFELKGGSGLEGEHVSKEPVKPAKIIEYPSALDVMLENGVQAYFIDKETEARKEKSEDHGRSIFRNMESENQKRGVNVKSF